MKKSLLYNIKLASSAAVARRAPSLTSELKISVQPAVPASPLGTCVKRNEKIVPFMHIQNSFRRNGDHLNLLINTGNAHKKRMLL